MKEGLVVKFLSHRKKPDDIGTLENNHGVYLQSLTSRVSASLLTSGSELERSKRNPQEHLKLTEVPKQLPSGHIFPVNALQAS